MLMPFFSIVAGLALLVWGADRFVSAASTMARNLGVSPLIIGLTIIGFGTSAPEILVAGVASYEGNPGLAIGNALGSNIANIALILGITALISPLIVRSETLRREYPVMVLVTVLAFGLSLDGRLGQIDGVILLSALAASLIWAIRIAKTSKSTDPIRSDLENELETSLTTRNASLWLFIGLLTLLAGSKLLVYGGIEIAQMLGVSDLIIGLTIVAIGTSLPELAASVVAARRNEHDLAVGNIIGSNIYNLLAVFSLPGLISPSTLAPEVLSRDFPVVLGLTLLLFLIARGKDGIGTITRYEGLALLATFAAYQGVLYVSVQA